MRFGEGMKPLRAGIRLRVRLADDPKRRLGAHGSLSEFEHALAFGNRRRADQPRPALRRLRVQEGVLDSVGHNMDFPGRRAVEFFQQKAFPFSQCHACVCELVGITVKQGDAAARQYPHHRPVEEFLQLDPRGGTGALSGKPVGNNKLASFLLRSEDVITGHPAKMAQDISRLSFVPPAHRFDGDADLLEGRQGLLNLDLHAAVGQHERQVAVKKNLHT